MCYLYMLVHSIKLINKYEKNIFLTKIKYIYSMTHEAHFLDTCQKIFTA